MSSFITSWGLEPPKPTPAGTIFAYPAPAPGTALVEGSPLSNRYEHNARACPVGARSRRSVRTPADPRPPGAYRPQYLATAPRPASSPRA